VIFALVSLHTFCMKITNQLRTLRKVIFAMFVWDGSIHDVFMFYEAGLPKYQHVMDRNALLSQQNKSLNDVISSFVYLCVHNNV